jgi:transglutaminase-like putative cysteine protease
MTRFARRTVVATAILAAVAAADAPRPDSGAREWEITYRATITDIPAEARSFRIWLPLPRDDQRQTISSIEVDAPLVHRRVIDPEYGNRLLQFEAEREVPDSMAITMTVIVRRQTGLPILPADTSLVLEARLARFLAPDSLVPITGTIADLTRSVTEGLSDDRACAEAIYAYVLRTMRYDKSGTGWGQGDALFACNERRGNCSDIHSLLIGMARSAGIPARFVMGFSFPANVSEGTVAGYHCWADLYLEGSGWVPVDASEAIKNPALADYYFGRLDPDRVAFTIGRDILLGDEDDAPRVNYLIYPHVQVGGRGDAATVRWEVTYRATPR